MTKLLRNTAVFILSLALVGCAAMRFERVEPPPAPVVVDSLETLAHKEAWFGLVFSGERVGFTHYQVEKRPDGLFEIFSEGHFHIVFMGVNQKISIQSWDVVGPRLGLVSFRAKERIGEKERVIEGRVEENVLRLKITVAGATKNREIRLKEPLFPSVAMEFYPLFHGLYEGKEYSYTVFDAENSVVSRVTQEVGPLVKNPALFSGAGFKVMSELAGVKSTSWVNPRGLTLLERTLGGVLIRYPESERMAKKYLATAALNKKELVLEISRINVDRDIPCPREARRLTVDISGLKDNVEVISDGRQAGGILEDGSAIRFSVDVEKDAGAFQAISKKDRIIYTMPTASVESDDAAIKAKAGEIAGSAADEEEKMERILEWVDKNVEDAYEDSFSALDVLKNPKGECQAHTLLYTALARAAGLPTRIASGLVYLEDMGFLYHAWAETYANGRWHALDPTFGQKVADATHIKFTQGTDFYASLKISELIGKIEVRVVSFGPECKENKEGPQP